MKNRFEEWEKLRITNNFIFAKVMEDNEICKKVLELLLNFEISEILNKEVEKSIAIAPSAKGIRLDVYVKEENKIYNVEMQVSNGKNVPKRSRYYQSMIDLNTIEKGELYDKLADSYVIFICTFDPFGKAMPLYTFENFCREDKELSLNDRTYKLFFNTKGYGDIPRDDLKELMAYINGSSHQENEFVSQLDAKVKEIKSNEKWREDYMTLQLLEQERYAEGIEVGRAEGKAEGRTEGRAEGIYAMIRVLLELGLGEAELLQKIAEQFTLNSAQVSLYYKEYLEKEKS